jgi:nucleoside-diphosphate-sugar epimerase
MSLISKIRRKRKTTNNNEEEKQEEKEKELRTASDLDKAKKYIISSKDNLAVVFGANSALGRTVVEELLNEGRRVRVVLRNKFKTEKDYQDKLVEIHKINYKNVIQVINSVEKGSIIYNCVKVPHFRWFRNYPLIAYNLIHATKKKQAKLVHIDNCTVYGRMKTKKITERDPLIPESDEGSMRKKVAEQIIIGHQREDYETVIVRFPDMYGPYITDIFAKNVFERPKRNQAAKWFVSLDKKHSLIYIKDAAKALIRIAEDPTAYGEVWHVTGKKPITGEDFLKLVFKELGKEQKISKRSKLAINFEKIFDEEMSRISDVLEQWEYSFIIDGSKFNKTYPEFEFTPHSKAIKETLDWQTEYLKRKRRRRRAWPLLSFYHPYRW